MKKATAFFFLAMTIGAGAQESDEAHYRRCLSLSETNGQSAYDESLRWKDAGGGAPAEHCSALALISLKHYRDGARILDALSQNPSLDATLRADIASQAGSAWLQAGSAQNAERSLSRSLAINPSDMEARLDRAVARAKLKNWQGADEDLSAILERNPARVDLLLLRASARHAHKSMAGAWADIERVLALKPNEPAALLERGAMRSATGDAAGARADWQKILEVAPNSREAETARKQLNAGMAIPKKSKPAPPNAPARKAKPAQPKPAAQAKAAATPPQARPRAKPAPMDGAPIKLRPPPVKTQPKAKRPPTPRVPQLRVPQEYGSGPIE